MKFERVACILAFNYGKCFLKNKGIGGIYMPIFYAASILMLGIFLISSYWLKVNEFYEWKFGEIKVFSKKAAIACLVAGVVLSIAGRIRIEIRMKENTDRFIEAYLCSFNYEAKKISIANEDLDGAIMDSGGYKVFGDYSLRRFKVEELLSIELDRIRNKEAWTMEKWFGTKDVDLNMVYCREPEGELIKTQDGKEVYNFNLYYIDGAERIARENRCREDINSKYSDMNEVERESLVMSYMNQYDIDREFDVAHDFVVDITNSGDIIPNDEIRAFLLKK